MTVKAHPVWRVLRLAVVVLSLLWLGGTLYLDFAYGMFPQVLFGGLKILVAGYLALAILLMPLYFLIRLLKLGSDQV